MKTAQTQGCPDCLALGGIGFSRRDFLRVGLGGAVSLGVMSSVSSLFADTWISPAAKEAAAKAAAAAGGPPAKHLILLWLDGGPSQLDTFDPKPGTSTGGEFKAIKTAVNGMELCEHLPRLAERAADLCVVRSMSTSEGNHQRARYLLHTGYSPNPTVKHPSLGSILSYEVGKDDADLPNFISLVQPSFGAGFLGVSHDPFVVRDPRKPVDNVELPQSVDQARFTRRTLLANYINTRFAASYHGPELEGEKAIREKTLRFMGSKQLAAFELDSEPQRLRANYGDNPFGQGCLMARRLVEAGVPAVEVALGGWDTHQDNFTRTKSLMGQLDPAFAALIADLRQRELLDQTVIVCMGEFGRTPRINPNDGRDHYPQAWSAVLAGAGIRTGQFYGSTNEDGTRVVSDRVGVPDLFASLVTLFGINPVNENMSNVGRPIGITDKGKPIAQLLKA